MKLKTKLLITSLFVVLTASVTYNISMYQMIKSNQVSSITKNNDFDQSFAKQVNFNQNSSYPTDQLISRNTAKTMALYYEQNPNHLSINNYTLSGFRVKRGTVENILAQDDITELYLMFGVSPATLNNPVAQQEFTIAVMGIEDDGTPYGTIPLDGLIYDFLEPCPNKCPYFP